MRAARVDGNHQELVAAFRGHGCSVVSLAAMGKGVPDLLVGYQGVTYLVEVKDRAQPPSKRRLRQSQTAFRDGWVGSKVAVVESVDGVHQQVARWRYGVD